MPINDTQKHLLVMHANRISGNLLEGFFRGQSAYIANDHSLEAKYLAMYDNIIATSFSTQLYDDTAYEVYVKKVILALGYAEADVVRTSIYKDAVDLRSLFRANKEVLEKKFGLETRFGGLPSDVEVFEFLSSKFHALATSFRAKMESHSIEFGGVEKFVRAEINRIIDPEEYMLG